MFIKNGDDPKAKILRVIDAEEINAPMEDLIKKDKKAEKPIPSDIKTEGK